MVRVLIVAVAGASLATLAVAADTSNPAKSPAMPPGLAEKALAPIALVNPGFESAKAGSSVAAEGWAGIHHASNVSYTFTLDDKIFRSGTRSLRIDNTGPEVVGIISQAISALPHRGKTLRFSGWIRTHDTKGNPFGAGAGLMLQAMAYGSPQAFAHMRENAINGTTDWTRYQLKLTVPQDAQLIEVGMMLFGPGAAWLDDAALDVVEPDAASNRS
jgi:hypothetical protein